ncbi:MAG: DUF397 domain-containing protein [Pseudonocardiaceae bacterium]
MNDPVPMPCTYVATCVEIGWRISSHSSNSGTYIEVAPAPEGVLIRDSEGRIGPALHFLTPT